MTSSLWFVLGWWSGAIASLPWYLYWRNKALKAEEALQNSITLPLPTYDGSGRKPKYDHTVEVMDDKELATMEMLEVGVIE